MARIRSVKPEQKVIRCGIVRDWRDLHTTSLYRFHSRSGALLYVGITQNWHFRWDAHRIKAPWWRYAYAYTVESYPTRWQAEDAERQAIYTEQPVFNKRSRKAAV